MPATYQHTTRTIIQYLLVSLGMGTLPEDDGDWPIHSGTEPEQPDNCITIGNTQGFDYGRIMIDGERSEHPGFQVRIRCNDDEQGEAKLGEVLTKLDKEVISKLVEIDGVIYCVQYIRRTSVVDQPLEVPSSNRVVFFINAVTHIVKVTS